MRYSLITVVVLISLISCEEVIEVDLNTSNPAFVVEAIIYKDSVSNVRLTSTTDYFSIEEADYIEDALIRVSDGILTEELVYKGNGFYVGNTVIGEEEKTYEIAIVHNGITYEGISLMPLKTNIISIGYAKSDAPSIFNSDGKTMFTIEFSFLDDPDKDNFYMIRYILDGEVLKDSYYLLTESSAVNGSLRILNNNSTDNDTIIFSEAIINEGGEAEVQIFSIAEEVYNYFVQLNDVLYWKRRLYPPAQYNPESNISNGVLGYFAAWSYDSKKILLE